MFALIFTNYLQFKWNQVNTSISSANGSIWFESVCLKFYNEIMQIMVLEQTALALINSHHPVTSLQSPTTQKQINQIADNLIDNFVSQLFLVVMNENHYQVKCEKFRNDLFWSSFSLLFSQSLTLVRLKKCQSKEMKKKKTAKLWQSGSWNKASAYKAYCARNAVPT